MVQSSRYIEKSNMITCTPFPDDFILSTFMARSEEDDYALLGQSNVTNTATVPLSLLCTSQEAEYSSYTTEHMISALGLM